MVFHPYQQQREAGVIWDRLRFAKCDSPTQSEKNDGHQMRNNKLTKENIQYPINMSISPNKVQSAINKNVRGRDKVEREMGG